MFPSGNRKKLVEKEGDSYGYGFVNRAGCQAVKAYLEKEGSIPPSIAEEPKKTALILTEDHCVQVCSLEKNDSELCKVTCALKEKLRSGR
jgi:hypothetical protein